LFVCFVVVLFNATRLEVMLSITPGMTKYEGMGEGSGSFFYKYFKSFGLLTDAPIAKAYTIPLLRTESKTVLYITHSTFL